MSSFQFEFDSKTYSITVDPQHTGFQLDADHIGTNHYSALDYQGLKMSLWGNKPFFDAFENAYKEWSND